jgi:hypothetical protein
MHHGIEAFKPRCIKRSCTLIPSHIATRMIGCAPHNPSNIMTASREKCQ